MSRTLTRGVGAVLATLTLLAGCTNDADPGPSRAGEPVKTAGPLFSAHPSPTLNGQPWDGRVIPNDVQLDLDGAAYGYTAAERPWVSRSRMGADGVEAVLQRRVPGCDSGPWMRLPSDQQVLDFQGDVRVDGPYVISRQVTVYPTVEAARAFTDDLEDHTIGCRSFRGAGVEAFQRSEYAADRFVGIPDRFDGTEFSQGYLTTERPAVNIRWVDVVTRHVNAVAFTRVAEPSYDGQPDVIGRLDQEPRFVRALVAEGRRQLGWMAAFDEYAAQGQPAR